MAELAGWVQEALKLRMTADLPVVNTSPATALVFLGDVRARLDRVEELLGKAIRHRATARRAQATAQAQADDAFDTAITRHRAAPVQSGGDFLSARERTAAANLAVLDLLHQVRAIDRLVSTADEAVEVLRLTHRGLDGLRQDSQVVLRTLAFESTLER